jgi:hypothetical protein
LSRTAAVRVPARVRKETAMLVNNWIVVLGCAYMEYSSWRGRNVYRRTVAYETVVWC